MDDKIIPFGPKNQKKSSVKSLTFTPPNQTNIEHREMEKLAEQVAMQFRSYDRSLGKLRPQIERIHDYFTTSVRGSVTLAGCGSFGEYCAKKLGRTRQAVYSMLGAYPERAKERKQRALKGERERDDEIPRDAVMRMRMFAALQLHAALSNIVEAGILNEGSALLMATKAALDAGKILAAVRKRLNIDQPTVQ